MYSEKGQTLLELVVVISVSVIVVGALVFATIASLRNASFSKNQAQATKLAQEGIEKVRVSRDRNRPILNLSPVASWNGTGDDDSIWDYDLRDDCEQQEPNISTRCYFNINSDGSLRFITGHDSTKLPLGAELLGAFTRAIILSNDINGNNILTDDPEPPNANALRVTAIVRWTDFSGPHESRLTTILRRL